MVHTCLLEIAFPTRVELQNLPGNCFASLLLLSYLGLPILVGLIYTYVAIIYKLQDMSSAMVQVTGNFSYLGIFCLMSNVQSSILTP